MKPTYLKYFLFNALHFAVFFWQEILQAVHGLFSQYQQHALHYNSSNNDLTTEHYKSLSRNSVNMNTECTL